MATRFYLPDDIAAPVSPAYWSVWHVTPDDPTEGRRMMVTSKTNSAAASHGTTEATATANRNFLLRQYVSMPITAQTITGTARAQVITRQSAPGVGIHTYWGIKVVSGDGLTERGWLSYGSGAGLGTSQLTDTFENRSIPHEGTDATLMSVTAEAGDRIVVELGGRRRYAVAGTQYMEFRDDLASDLAAVQTGTADGNPWVEFSHNVTFVTDGGGGVPSVTAIRPQIIGLGSVAP